MSNYGQGVNRNHLTKARERALMPVIIADHGSTRG
jgi:hypothetical protein